MPTAHFSGGEGALRRWRPLGERAGRWGNEGHGDQAEFLRASQQYDRLSGEKSRILEERLQIWKQHRANSQRNIVYRANSQRNIVSRANSQRNIVFIKMQRTTMSGSLATGSQHLRIKLETQV